MENKVQEVLEQPELILSHLPQVKTENWLIYIAGSLLEGFGNSTSDLDVFILCDELPNRESFILAHESVDQSLLIESRTILQNIVYKNFRYDFTYLLKQDFDKMINKVNTINFNSENGIRGLNKKEIDILHRFKFAKPILNNEDIYLLQKSINYPDYDYYVSIYELHKYAAILEDLQGAYSSNDIGTAFFNLRRLCDTAVTAFLAVNGETNPSIKWIYRKIKRYELDTGDQDLMIHYLTLQNQALNEDDFKSHIKNGMKFCQKLNDKTQLLIKGKQQDKKLIGESIL